ncbi:MAG: GyrI-like domain-containing protein [Dysgonomonas sp.]|nr:GyrI-like domain-containing protein [Dysgonomonas sp.]
MKKLVKILLAIIIGIVIIISAVYAYYGGFKSVDFEIENTGGEIFVYESVTGNYNQSPVVMESVYYALLNDFKIETTKGVGIYYDNPQQVEESKLRSDLGCFLDTPVDSITMANLSARFKIKTMPQGEYIVTKTPNKGVMSIMVGIIKVYPAMNNYIEKNGYKNEGAVTEIYDTPTKTIIYRKEAVK